MGSQADIDRHKAEIKQSLERVRGAIRMRVHPRHQTELLDAVDRIQEAILGSADAGILSGNFQRGKDSARKSLRNRPVDMVQILNEFGNLEDEITKFIQALTKGSK